MATDGLTYITTGTLSSVTTLSINNCFSNTYLNYLLLIEGLAGPDESMYLRLRASGSDSSTGYVEQYGAASSTSLNAARNTLTGARVGIIDDTYRSQVTCRVYAPYIADRTQFVSLNVSGQGNAGLYTWANQHSVATAYDGFTIYTGGTSFTGYVHVYGYTNS